MECGGVGVGVERDPDSAGDSKAETRRFAAELSPNAICGPIQPTETSFTAVVAEASERGRPERRVTAADCSECKSSMDRRPNENECKTCITSHHADSPS